LFIVHEREKRLTEIYDLIVLENSEFRESRVVVVVKITISKINVDLILRELNGSIIVREFFDLSSFSVPFYSSETHRKNPEKRNSSFFYWKACRCLRMYKSERSRYSANRSRTKQNSKFPRDKIDYFIVLRYISFFFNAYINSTKFIKKKKQRAYFFPNTSDILFTFLGRILLIRFRKSIRDNFSSVYQNAPSIFRKPYSRGRRPQRNYSNFFPLRFRSSRRREFSHRERIFVYV